MNLLKYIVDKLKATLGYNYSGLTHQCFDLFYDDGKLYFQANANDGRTLIKSAKKHESAFEFYKVLQDAVAESVDFDPSLFGFCKCHKWESFGTEQWVRGENLDESEKGLWFMVMNPKPGIQLGIYRQTKDQKVPTSRYLGDTFESHFEATFFLSKILKE